jgi:hypothetical protein
VYPASANVGTLSKEFLFNAGSTCAFLASAFKVGYGSSTVADALVHRPSGIRTTLVDGPVFGKFSSFRTKFDVAPESITIGRPLIISYNFLMQGMIVFVGAVVDS